MTTPDCCDSGIFNNPVVINNTLSLIGTTSLTNVSVNELTIGMLCTTPGSVTTGFGVDLTLVLTDTVGPVTAIKIDVTWLTSTDTTQTSQICSPPLSAR